VNSEGGVPMRKELVVVGNDTRVIYSLVELKFSASLLTFTLLQMTPSHRHFV
jgi:hypothetical protein